MAEPRDIIERLRLDPDSTIFALGCRERRVTLYAQQVRALNLAWALQEAGRLVEGTRVIIVGAGAAGLTTGLGFARKGAAVDIVERNEVILPRFRGNMQRFLHPHAFDWPHNSANQHEAQLPLMNWRAAMAFEVVAQLERAWAVERSGMPNLKLRLNTAVDSIDVAQRLVRLGGGIYESQPYDIIVLAVGVGTERRQYGTPTYWENDALAQPSVHGPTRLLISGNGDGGLVDVLRASLTDFDHARLMRQLLGASDAYSIGPLVHAIERQAQSDRDFDLDAAYARLDLSKFSRLLQGRTRMQRQVTLSIPGSRLYRPDTMALNRLLVECLRREGLEIVCSRIVAVDTIETGKRVRFENGVERDFDVAVFRHGPANDLEALFPALTRAAQPVDFHLGDDARKPRWPSNYFAPKTSTNAFYREPVRYDIIELDEGFGLTSRAWSLNNYGQVVGWTYLGTGAEHGFFVWGGSGLPPELGHIPGIRNTAATDINDNGDYVVTTEGGSRQAWLVSGSRLLELRADGDRAMPYSVNNRREIVGWCNDHKGESHPCIWESGTLRRLPDLGFGGVAMQINDSGIVVGEVKMDEQGHLAAARWRNGQLETFKPLAPFYSARAFRVNAHGLTVGYLMREGHHSHFFLWPIGDAPEIIEQGEAYGVNDEGWIAGRTGKQGAFLCRERRMIWLDKMIDPAWTIKWPFRLINDLRMVGVGCRNGIDRAVLLVPRFN